MSNKLLKQLKSIGLGLFISYLIASAIYTPPVQAAKSLELEDKANLEETVSKGYSNKFCNAIGMGVSKEGALKLAITENSKPSFNPSLWLDLAFSGNEKFNSLDQDRIIELASDQVINRCGIAINITNESERIDFKDEFRKQAKTNKI
ncbi:hypothetical protein [Prochlorococcus sp. MIT 1341]|uniref:hypothetical protein n=1 Tax=Prochlorococcus sp. MIT 1341 TaxID=3096221 RepID=UPI002A74C10B|nr:hypothetical protein [Prochlorococcus sp. MIT 1341]